MDFPRRSTRSTLTDKTPEEERGALDEVSDALKAAGLEGIFVIPDAEDPDAEDPDAAVDGEVDPFESPEEEQKMSEAEKKELQDEGKQMKKNLQLDELLKETEQGEVFQPEAGPRNLDKFRAPSREMEPGGMLTNAVKAFKNLARLPEFIRKRMSRGDKAIRFLIFEYQENIAEVVDENGDICDRDDEKWSNRGFNLIGTAPYKAGGRVHRADSLWGILGTNRIVKAKIPKQGVSVHDKVYVVPFPWNVSEENEKKWGRYLTEAAKPEKKAALAQAAIEVKATGKRKQGLKKGDTEIEVLVWKVSEKCLEDAENGKEETSNHWIRDKKSGQFVPACARKPEDGKPWKTPGEKISGRADLQKKVGCRVKVGYRWQGYHTAPKGEPRHWQGKDWPVGTQRLLNEYWVESVKPTPKLLF